MESKVVRSPGGAVEFMMLIGDPGPDGFGKATQAVFDVLEDNSTDDDEGALRRDLLEKMRVQFPAAKWDSVTLTVGQPFHLFVVGLLRIISEWVETPAAEIVPQLPGPGVLAKIEIPTPMQKYDGSGCDWPSAVGCPVFFSNRNVGYVVSLEASTLTLELTAAAGKLEKGKIWGIESAQVFQGIGGGLIRALNLRVENEPVRPSFSLNGEKVELYAEPGAPVPGPLRHFISERRGLPLQDERLVDLRGAAPTAEDCLKAAQEEIEKPVFAAQDMAWGARNPRVQLPSSPRAVCPAQPAEACEGEENWVPGCAPAPTGNWLRSIGASSDGLHRVNLFDEDNGRTCLEIGVNGCTSFLSRDEAIELNYALGEWLGPKKTRSFMSAERALAMQRVVDASKVALKCAVKCASVAELAAAVEALDKLGDE